MHKEAIWQNRAHNQKIQGLALDGKVIDITRNAVKIHLDIDEEQPKEQAQWFPYAAEGNNVWYLMPELQSRVKLHFINTKEEDAIVINSVRQQPKTEEAAAREQTKMNDPGEKSLRTPCGKEIDFRENDISLSAKEGVLYISLDESEGITIKSDNDIVFSSEQDITLEAKKIEIKAQQEIILACRESSIILTEEQLGINSPQTSIEGSEKKEYTPIQPEFVQQQAEKNNNILDKIQGGLGIAGICPGIGNAASLINAGISAARGDWKGAGLSLLAAIPVVGNVGKIGASIFKVGKIIAKKAPNIVKAVETASKVISGVAKVTTLAYFAMGIRDTAQEMEGMIQDIKAGDLDFRDPNIYASAVLVLANIKGNKRGKSSANQNPEVPSKPTEPYNRKKHYGNTPTRQDREVIGGSPDHDPPLVKRYYEGDPKIGEKPGYQQTQEERKAAAQDRSRMKPSTKEEQNRQGGQMSQYSKEKKKEHGFDK